MLFFYCTLSDCSSGITRIINLFLQKSGLIAIHLKVSVINFYEHILSKPANKLREDAAVFFPKSLEFVNWHFLRQKGTTTPTTLDFLLFLFLPFTSC